MVVILLPVILMFFTKGFQMIYERVNIKILKVIGIVFVILILSSNFYYVMKDILIHVLWKM